MSKAVLSLQKTQVFQRAIFFTLLNPQPNGAAFAGARTKQGQFNADLTGFESIVLKVRANGNATHYKVTLRHNNEIKSMATFIIHPSFTSLNIIEQTRCQKTLI